MNRNSEDYLRLLSVRCLLLIAAALLLMFLGTLQSHFLYNAPNLRVAFSFTFLIPCVYCFIAGIGLLKLKKWALLLLFWPGVLLMAAYVHGEGAKVPMPWALMNYAFWATLIVFPIYMLRYWNTFKWR